MQRTVSLNGREYELVQEALEHAIIYLRRSTMMEPDELKMLIEEHLNLHRRFKEQADTPSGGTYIDGVRV